MVAILLAVVGVPLWLVAGMVLGALYSRHRFKQAPGVFRCKLRLIAGTAGSLKTTWGRAPAYGRWVHDVLLVNQGLALVRVMPIPVTGVAAMQLVEAADLDRDGDADLAFANHETSAVTVLLNDGRAHFTAAAGSPTAAL